MGRLRKKQVNLLNVTAHTDFVCAHAHTPLILKRIATFDCAEAFKRMIRSGGGSCTED